MGRKHLVYKVLLLCVLTAFVLVFYDHLVVEVCLFLSGKLMCTMI